jgi:hypothetical protein
VLERLTGGLRWPPARPLSTWQGHRDRSNQRCSRGSWSERHWSRSGSKSSRRSPSGRPEIAERFPFSSGLQHPGFALALVFGGVNLWSWEHLLTLNFCRHAFYERETPRFWSACSTASLGKWKEMGSCWWVWSREDMHARLIWSWARGLLGMPGAAPCCWAKSPFLSLANCLYVSCYGHQNIFTKVYIFD